MMKLFFLVSFWARANRRSRRYSIYSVRVRLPKWYRVYSIRWSTENSLRPCWFRSQRSWNRVTVSDCTPPALVTVLNQLEGGGCGCCRADLRLIPARFAQRHQLLAGVRLLRNASLRPIASYITQWTDEVVGGFGAQPRSRNRGGGPLSPSR